MQHRDLGGVAHVAARHRDRFSQVVRAFPAQHRRHVRVFSAGGDHFADVLAAVLAPVPHEKRMRAVIGVAAPVHLHIARIVCKLRVRTCRASTNASRVSGSRRLKNSM